MPETRTFDTHAAVKVLTDAGAEPELAEAFVAVARDAGDHSDHVTSDRLDAALANLRLDIGQDLLARPAAPADFGGGNHMRSAAYHGNRTQASLPRPRPRPRPRTFLARDSGLIGAEKSVAAPPRRGMNAP